MFSRIESWDSRSKSTANNQSENIIRWVKSPKKREKERERKRMRGDRGRKGEGRNRIQNLCLLSTSSLSRFASAYL